MSLQQRKEKKREKYDIRGPTYREMSRILIFENFSPFSKKRKEREFENDFCQKGKRERRKGYLGILKDLGN